MSAPMRPSFKKWKEAPEGEKPCQIAMFMRMEDGRTVELSVDTATTGEKAAALELLRVVSTTKGEPNASVRFTETAG